MVDLKLSQWGILVIALELLNRAGHDRVDHCVDFGEALGRQTPQVTSSEEDLRRPVHDSDLILQLNISKHLGAQLQIDVLNRLLVVACFDE